jgi:hypothetical protein
MPPPRPQETLRLTEDDLFSPRVDAFLDEQAMRNRAMPEAAPQPWILRVLYSSYFYLSLAIGLGAFVAWTIFEPFVEDSQELGLSYVLMFPTVMSSVFRRPFSPVLPS